MGRLSALWSVVEAYHERRRGAAIAHEPVGVVFRKEMTEALRDRRTLLVALLLPVVMTPVVTLGIPWLAQRQQARIQTAPARVAVRGRANAPDLVAFGASQRLIAPVPVLQPEEALRRGQVDAVLEIPPDFARRLTSGHASVIVLYDEGTVGSRIARQRVQELIASYSVRISETRLRARGLSAQDLAPIDLQVHDIADERKLGGVLLAGFLPFFISLWAVLGGQYAALDLGVGEKERRTLDTLLLVPSPRWVLAVGKFLAVVAASMTAVIVVIATTLLSVRLGGVMGLADLRHSSVAIAPGPAVALVGIAVLLVGFLSSVQLVLSFLARSIREAQQYFTPLYLFLVLPAMVIPFLEGWARSPWTYLLPALNAAFVFRELLLGTPIASHLLLTVLTLALWTVGSLWLVIIQLQRERTLSRG